MEFRGACCTGLMRAAHDIVVQTGRQHSRGQHKQFDIHTLPKAHCNIHGVTYTPQHIWCDLHTATHVLQHMCCNTHAATHMLRHLCTYAATLILRHTCCDTYAATLVLRHLCCESRCDPTATDASTRYNMKRTATHMHHKTRIHCDTYIDTHTLRHTY